MQLPDDTVADLLAAGRRTCELAADAMDAYIASHGHAMPDAAGRAQAFILCRCLADVRATALLSTSCYPAQIASIIRSTHESMCVVKMFHHEPEEAETWWRGEKRYRVQDVRKRAKLDEEHPFEALYSYLCGLSHARSEGIDTQYTLGDRTGSVSTGPVFYTNPRVLDAGYQVISTMVEVADGFLDHFPLAEEAPKIDQTIRHIRALLGPVINAYAQAFAIRDPETRDDMMAIRNLVSDW